MAVPKIGETVRYKVGGVTHGGTMRVAVTSEYDSGVILLFVRTEDIIQPERPKAVAGEAYQLVGDPDIYGYGTKNGDIFNRYKEIVEAFDPQRWRVDLSGAAKIDAGPQS